jgi:NAD-dependent SIR2 family protein deacetylase
MTYANGFRFERAKTCFIVGAGASASLCYPSFCGAESVSEILAHSIAKMGEAPAIAHHRERCQKLASDLARRYNFDLERVYEHLAHVPPGFYDPPLYTHWMCQQIVSEIVDRFSHGPPAEGFADIMEGWRELLSRYERPAGIFTTNYDLVLESVLQGASEDYANGWERGQYLRENFEGKGQTDLALVKLHGSADWIRAAQYTTLEVRKEAPRVTARPACLAPLRRKWHTEEPYASGYDFLEESIRAADDLVVLGFSWRDLSVASALRSALWRRGGRPLRVYVYDPQPYAVEERVRRFLHETGARQMVPQLEWYACRGPFPRSAFTDAAPDRAVLEGQASLSDSAIWAVLRGEPKMVDPPCNGRPVSTTSSRAG